MKHAPRESQTDKPGKKKEGGGELDGFDIGTFCPRRIFSDAIASAFLRLEAEDGEVDSKLVERGLVFGSLRFECVSPGRGVEDGLHFQAGPTMG